MSIYYIQGKKVSVHLDGHVFVYNKYTQLKQWKCGKRYSNSLGREQKDVKGKSLNEALYIRGFLSRK